MKKRLVNPMLEHYRVLYKRGNYGKSQFILAELQEEFGYHRKAAIRLLNGYKCELTAKDQRELQCKNIQNCLN
jgi:hypothetical protein